MPARSALRVLPLLLLVAGCALFDPPDRRFTVFFAENSAALTLSGQEAVQAAAEVARRHPGSRVNVLGFTSPAGAPAALSRLSIERAEAVAGALAQSGIPASRIAIGARGPVPVEFADVEGRRVEILLANP